MLWKLATHLGEYELLAERLEQLSVPLEIYRPTVMGEPIFFDYLFARETASVNLADVSLWLPLYWVMFGRKIAALDDSEIAKIRTFADLESRLAQRLASAEEFGSTYRDRVVEITTGVFGGIFGKVLRPGPRGSVVVEILFVGRPIECTVGVRDVRLVEPRAIPANQSADGIRSDGAPAPAAAGATEPGVAAISCAAHNHGTGAGDDEV